MSTENKFPIRIPFFASVIGSIEEPGVMGKDWYGLPVSTYEVKTIAAGEMLVVKHVSAGVVRGNVPYPTENINDLGEIGFIADNGDRCSHLLPFTRKEPGALLFTSQSICLYVPSNAILFVSVPLIGDQSGGAKIDVSGYSVTT
ncbi:hypothetical protein JYT30_01025 [Desulfotalea psychrophila]|uniref:Uncharacterized protein n=1 Tax=Desulfotalea psychrophila TaxID=84980 RepID=A0ABS3AUR5_9BACT|nr:hypothetical protein [Desulfocapsa sp.]MBN4068382.1 hypothetical protein [Desulfotalea psychrophila]MBN4071725.1 hypothetical protein [Desulfotalea psychrophila]